MAYDRFQAGLAPGDLTVVDTVGATVGPPASAGSTAPLASESAPTSGGSASPEAEAVSSTLPEEGVDSAVAAGARAAQVQPLVGSLGVSPTAAGDGDMPSSPPYASRSPTPPTKGAVPGTEDKTAGGASGSPGEATPPHRSDSVAEGAEEARSGGEMAGERKDGGEEEPCAITAAEEDVEGRTAREEESFDAVGEIGREEAVGGVPRTAEGGPVAIQSELVTASPTGSEVLSAHAEDPAKEMHPEEPVRIRRKKRTIDETGES